MRVRPAREIIAVWYGTRRHFVAGCLALVFVLLLAFPRITTAQNNVTYVYDQTGRLVGVIDPSGSAAAYTYDSVGNLLSITRYTSTQISILSFTPQAGAVGTTVTIYGTGFSTTASQDAVSFNGVAATVTSATGNILVTSVPASATTGPITVTTPAGSATSSSSFTVTTLASAGAPPTITGFTPTVGVAGTSVTISGTGFQTAPANNKVRFNANLAEVSSSTPESIVTSVPGQTASGRISVATPYGKAISSADFFIPPPPYTAANVGFTGRAVMGQSSTATVPAGEIGLLVFDATAGTRVSANFTNATFNSCWTVSILDPRESTVASTSSCGVSAFIDATDLVASGTYTIEILPGNSATGSVAISVYSVTDVTGPITAGGAAVPVNLPTPGQNAELSFSGTAGQRVSVNFTNGTFNGCWYGYLLNPDGSTLSSTGTCGETQFLDAIALPSTGTYTVKVDPSSATTGNVTVNLYTVVDFTGSITAGGAAVPVNLPTPGQNAELSFSGTAGQRVSVNFTNGTFNGCWYGYLLNPDGSTLSSTGTCGETQFLDAIALPSTGTYTVKVDPSSATTGNVTVNLYAVVDVTGPITVGGSAVPVDLSTPGQNAYLSFSGNASQQVTVHITSNTTCSTVKLLDPSGATLTSTYSCGSSFNLAQQTLSANGTYTVSIDPNGTSTGGITVAVTSP